MAITRTQSNKASAAGTGASLGVSLVGIAAASLVVHWSSNDTSGGTVATLTDDLAVAATRVAAAAIANATLGQRVDGFHYTNYGGGNRTSTAGFTGSPPFRAGHLVEYAGAATVTPQDKANASTGNSAAPASGSVTPSTDGQVVVGFAAGQNAVTTGAAFNIIQTEATVNTGSEDIIQTTAGASNPAWTMTSGQWAAAVMTFKAAGGAAAPTYPELERQTRGMVRGAL